eukprot:g53952.t1
MSLSAGNRKGGACGKVKGGACPLSLSRKEIFVLICFLFQPYHCKKNFAQVSQPTTATPTTAISCTQIIIVVSALEVSVLTKNGCNIPALENNFQRCYFTAQNQKRARQAMRDDVLADHTMAFTRWWTLSMRS